MRGPLADRIDMMIDVTRPDPQVTIEGAEGMSSAELRDYVVRGRAFRAWRESRMDDADAGAEDDESRSIDGVVSTFALDEAARNACSACRSARISRVAASCAWYVSHARSPMLPKANGLRRITCSRRRCTREGGTNDG